MIDDEVPASDSNELELEAESNATNTAVIDALPSGGEWLIARKYLNTIGEPSALFTSTCRSLLTSSPSGANKLSRLAASQLSRLLKSPSMLAQLYYASKTYYPEDVASRGQIEPADFTFFIDPQELAILIAVGYTSRRIAHVLPEADWDLLIEPYQRYADLAIPLGFSIPSIGGVRAMMVACGRFLAWGIFNKVEPDRYKKYRVSNKVAKRSYMLKEESKNFGTTHLHIAAILWQKFGFGIEVSENYFNGLSDDSIEDLPSDAIKFKVARLWLESLLEKGEPPSQNLGDDYELLENYSQKFIATFQALKEKGSQFKWLSKNKSDIGVEKSPDLIVDYEAMNKVLKRRGRLDAQ